ncbi:MAG: YdeI family protein [Salibacteraceae bacterium]
MKMAKTVEEYFDTNKSHEPILLKLRNIMLRTELKEELKWGIPYYTLNGKHVVGIAAFKAYAGLWFTQGVFLQDPMKVLINAQENVTKGLRQWRFSDVGEVDEDLVYSYVLEAIENQKEGKEIKVAKKELVIPDELSQALDSDSNLKMAFEEFTYGKQREFADYIGSAKQDATRISRLRKCIPMIMNGQGLNDKYR